MLRHILSDNAVLDARARWRLLTAVPQAQLVVTKLRAAQLELERDEQLMVVRRLTVAQQHVIKGQTSAAPPSVKAKNTLRRRKASVTDDPPKVAGLS